LRVSTASPLTAAGLRKSYGGNEVVCGVDLMLQPGECFGLLGPNGAGKTTTLRLCLGLTGPDSGRITALGCEVPREAREARQRIGVVPQFDNLDPDFTIRENLRVFGRYFDIDDAALNARIPALLDFAGLSSRADTRIQTLSGGMKRRLTLARALINDPELLFLDEPTTGLDPAGIREFYEVLAGLKARGVTVVLSSHNLAEIEERVDRLALMRLGRIQASGTVAELRAQLELPVRVQVGLRPGAEEALRAALATLPGCTVHLASGSGHIHCDRSRKMALLALLTARGADVRDITIREPSLEDVFLGYTEN
jgi:lipooligosaccharide transport system ATP-binding protein